MVFRGIGCETVDSFYCIHGIGVLSVDRGIGIPGGFGLNLRNLRVNMSSKRLLSGLKYECTNEIIICVTNQIFVYKPK